MAKVHYDGSGCGDSDAWQKNRVRSGDWEAPRAYSHLVFPKQMENTPTLGFPYPCIDKSLNCGRGSSVTLSWIVIFVSLRFA